MKKYLYLLILILLNSFIFYLGILYHRNIITNQLKQTTYTLPLEVETIYVNDSLSEWQIFIMALVEVECERRPNSISSKGAIGPFQITQIYVDEINRLYQTDYVLSDATDLNKSLSMFELMNDYYNPSRDIDQAIQLHNPGAGNWYSKRIKDRMQLIKFNEALRFELLDLYAEY